jgi:hypothetical protein
MLSRRGHRPPGARSLDAARRSERQHGQRAGRTAERAGGRAVRLVEAAKVLRLGALEQATHPPAGEVRLIRPGLAGARRSRGRRAAVSGGMHRSRDLGRAREMSGFDKRYSAFDRFQQRHRWLGFPLAVLQKYADDQGGYLAATNRTTAFSRFSRCCLS